jgi:hypothetical protein
MENPPLLGPIRVVSDEYRNVPFGKGLPKV